MKKIFYEDFSPNGHTFTFNDEYINSLGEFSWGFEIMSFDKKSNYLKIYITDKDGGNIKNVASFKIGKRLKNSLTEL